MVYRLREISGNAPVGALDKGHRIGVYGKVSGDGHVGGDIGYGERVSRSRIIPGPAGKMIPGKRYGSDCRAVAAMLNRLSGAACALVASEFLIGGLAYIFVRRAITHIPIWPHLFRPVSAGIGLALVMHFIPMTNVLVAGCLAIVVYGLILLITQPEIASDIRSMLVHND